MELKERFLEPVHKIACMDFGRCAWRSELYPAYKAGRAKPEVSDFLPQMEALETALPGFGFIIAKAIQTEADDIIGTLCYEIEANTNERVICVSSDKDLWQLITDRVSIYDLGNNKIIDGKIAEETLGFPAARLVEYKALAGDTSDNIPGAKGIGEKGATEIVKAVPDLQQLLTDIEFPYEIRGSHPESDCYNFKIEGTDAKTEEEAWKSLSPESTAEVDYEIKKKEIPLTPALLKKVAASVDNIRLAGKLCSIAQHRDQLWSKEAQEVIGSVMGQIVAKTYPVVDEVFINSMMGQWRVREPSWTTAFR
jgi:5'-3' exonuclease